MDQLEDSEDSFDDYDNDPDYINDSADLEHVDATVNGQSSLLSLKIQIYTQYSITIKMLSILLRKG